MRTLVRPRMLNHVELVHAPGERALAYEVFELLGCTPRDSGGTFLTAMIEGSSTDRSSNTLYVSEVTPEQWAFEQSLRDALAADAADAAELGATSSAYHERLRREPQRSFHFGIRVDDRDEYDTTLERLANVAATHPHLAARLVLSGVFHPGDPGAYTDTMIQAFVWTDVFASGLLTIGQHVELQWQLPTN